MGMSKIAIEVPFGRDATTWSTEPLDRMPCVKNCIEADAEAGRVSLAVVGSNIPCSRQAGRRACSRTPWDRIIFAVKSVVRVVLSSVGIPHVPEVADKTRVGVATMRVREALALAFAQATFVIERLCLVRVPSHAAIFLENLGPEGIPMVLVGGDERRVVETASTPVQKERDRRWWWRVRTRFDRRRGWEG